MATFVSSQFGKLQEPFVADLASMNVSLARMRAGVPLQVGGAIEAAGADLTHVGMVSGVQTFVGLDVGGIGEAFAAVFTKEGTFAGVSAQVPAKMPQLGEAFVTIRAHMSPRLFEDRRGLLT